MGTCGSGNGAEGVYHAFADAIAQRGLDVHLVRTGCFGFCAEEPLVNVWLPGQPLVILRRVQTDHVNQILDDMAAKTIPGTLALCKIEEWDHLTAQIHYGDGFPTIPLWNEIPFFKRQKKIVLRNCGLINPDDIEEYIAVGGYQSLYKVLIDAKPELVIEQIKASKLRGRGGAGFSTGLMGIPAQGGGRPEIPHLQRRRGRPRRLHEPQRNRKRSALAARRHDDRRLRHRRHRRASSTCAPNIRWRSIG